MSKIIQVGDYVKTKKGQSSGRVIFRSGLYVTFISASSNKRMGRKPSQLEVLESYSEN